MSKDDVLHVTKSSNSGTKRPTTKLPAIPRSTSLESTPTPDELALAVWESAPAATQQRWWTNRSPKKDGVAKVARHRIGHLFAENLRRHMTLTTAHFPSAHRLHISLCLPPLPLQISIFPACVRACVRACARARVCVCVCVCVSLFNPVCFTPTHTPLVSTGYLSPSPACLVFCHPTKLTPHALCLRTPLCYTLSFSLPLPNPLGR